MRRLRRLIGDPQARREELAGPTVIPGSPALSVADAADYDSRVWGEIHRMLDPESVLSTLDEIEGFSILEPDKSLYIREEIPVMFEDGRVENAWVYFYNAPLGRAERIDSGDYLEHLRVR